MTKTIPEWLISAIKKQALDKLGHYKKELRDIHKQNREAGRHPLDRGEAETIVSQYFVEGGENWIRAVGLLHGQGYAASRYYYKNELPAQIEAADESGRIDIDDIIRRELGDEDSDDGSGPRFTP